jgi:hypothetical protein
VRLSRQTLHDQVWRAAERPVRVAGRDYRLIVAIDEATAAVKDFLTNAAAEPLRRVLAVALAALDGRAHLPGGQAGGGPDA